MPKKMNFKSSKLKIRCGRENVTKKKYFNYVTCLKSKFYPDIIWESIKSWGETNEKYHCKNIEKI